MFCPNCGKEVSEDFNLCPHCGTRLKGEDANGKVLKTGRGKGLLVGLIGGAAGFVSCFLPTITMASGGELYSFNFLQDESFSFFAIIAIILIGIATLVHIFGVRVLSMTFAIVNMVYVVLFSAFVLYNLTLTGGFFPSIGLIGHFAGSVTLLVGAVLLKNKK